MGKLTIRLITSSQAADGYEVHLMYSLSRELTVILVVAGVRDRPSIIKRMTKKFQMQRFSVRNPTI
jgi:hypothetical protein